MVETVIKIFLGPSLTHKKLLEGVGFGDLTSCWEATLGPVSDHGARGEGSPGVGTLPVWRCSPQTVCFSWIKPGQVSLIVLFSWLEPC